MKKEIVIMFMIALLTSTLAGILLVNSGRANPISEQRWDASPIISINSPIDNETFTSNDIPLNFTITKPEGWAIIIGREEIKNVLSSVDIIFDGTVYRSIEVSSNLSSPFSYSEILTNIPHGNHNVSINATCEGWTVETHLLWYNKFNYTTSSNLETFTVNQSFPAITALVSLAFVAIIGASAGLLVYFKKHKGNRNP
jgi:hypothetical protein